MRVSVRAPACGGVAVNSSNPQAGLARNSDLPPLPESASSRSLEVSPGWVGGGPAGLCYCVSGLHVPGAPRAPDKPLNGGDVTVMQAPAHPHGEKGAERGQRPARGRETERSQLRVPGRGRPCAPIPRLSPATSDQGWAWPRSLRRVPPTPHPRSRPAWSWPQTPRRSWAGDASQVRAAACSLRPPLGRREEWGRAGGEWARAEAQGWRTGGRRTPPLLRSLAETFQTGAGWGLGVWEARRWARSWRRGRAPRSGSPRTTPSALAASLRDSAANSDWGAGVLSAARYRGWGGQVSGTRGNGREAGLPALSVPPSRGAWVWTPVPARGREGRAQSSCGKFGISVNRRPCTFGGVASRSLPFPRSSLTPHGVSCALPSRGGGVAPLQPQTHSFEPSKTQSLKKTPRS